MHRVLLSRNAERYLIRLDKQMRERIIEAIRNLPAGEVKKLQGIEAYRLRDGDCRVIFEKDSRMLIILKSRLVYNDDMHKILAINRS